MQAVADELGVHPNQLRGWRNEQLAAGSTEATGTAEGRGCRAGPAAAEVKRLEQENELLKKAAAFFRTGGDRLMRYACRRRARPAFPVRVLCRIVGVAVSGFYAWQHRRPARRREGDARVSERIRAIFAESRRPRQPRVHAELRAEGVRSVGRKRVARLMREGGLAVARGGAASRVPPTAATASRSRPTCSTGIRLRAAGRGLAGRPQLHSDRGRLAVSGRDQRHGYPRDRRWGMADHLREELARDALLMAIQRRQPPPG